ncbi:MAG: glycosyl transferase family 1, partial [Bacteroidetes bacterium]
KGFIIAPNLPSKIKTAFTKERIKEEAVLKLISIARISKEKNTLYALQVLTDTNYSGKIKFDIYGSIYQQDYWNKCLEIIKSLPANITIKYKGEINNNIVLKTLQNYHFLFLPTLGENFGHSILESFSAACPVIISDQTPWINLEEKKIGWDIALAGTDKFVKTIQYCINMGQEEYNQLSSNAYEFAKSFASNPEIIEQSRKLFAT